MKGSLITPAQRGLPSSPIPETHPLLPLHPQFPPFISTQRYVEQHSSERRGGRGGLQRFSHGNTQVCTGVCTCVRTLNLPKQFFQCNWARGTCVHEIAQPLLHARRSRVDVPLLALQRRQLADHVLAGVFERLLSGRRSAETALTTGAEDGGMNTKTRNGKSPEEMKQRRLQTRRFMSTNPPNRSNCCCCGVALERTAGTRKVLEDGGTEGNQTQKLKMEMKLSE